MKTYTRDGVLIIDIEGQSVLIKNSMPTKELEGQTVPSGSIRMICGDDNSYPCLELSAEKTWSLGIGEVVLNQEKLEKILKLIDAIEPAD